ncbi:reverse transcriptase [Gossypium australe]|uniref:Reverse transcriptase n=1 Tax=Gossypium australe TaxID=47621 RepID=A0A5B6VNK0_9ROSI|nr:reverse transcriptase [Gossypium australe]
MNSIFKHLLRKTVLVFFDDILVFLATWEEHFDHIKEKASTHVKKSKRCFGTQQVEYLGHIIFEGKVAMDRNKVECVLNWPIPKTLKELRGFLGFSEYYRRFIKNYGIMDRPLTNLLKNWAWSWDEQATVAFE